MASSKQRLTAAEKEQQLLDKIAQAKQQLATLHEKRKKEIGQLAYKHGLHVYENKVLDEHLKRLAEDLKT